MDRSIFHLSFSKTVSPKWPCPSCKAGHLVIASGTIQQKETVASQKEHDHDAWEPEWMRSVFSCLFRCNSCKDFVACCGTARPVLFEYEDEEHGWVQDADERFDPKFFQPSLVLMDIPEECPLPAAEHLHASFSSFFSDPGASLNSVRAAVEAVLTDLGIKRFNVSGKKRRPLSLHQRILLLPAKYKEQADLLLAVKWLGNAGSHDSDTPERHDVSLAYDLLEHILSDIYIQKAKKLKSLAKKVNKKKGPIK
jgi:hypothetical protein